MSEPYNETVLDHFTNPRNIGEAAGATGTAVVRSGQCGDVLKLSLRVEGGVIREARMKTFGCAAAIASASILTILLKDRPVCEARAMKNDEVVRALGGLPEGKVACSVLAEDALKQALG